MNVRGTNIPQPFDRLLSHLHRGGGVGFWCYESTARKPDNPDRPVERESIWWDCNNPAAAPPYDGPNGLRHVWYGVHPCSEIPKTSGKGKELPPRYLRSQVDYINAINCLYAEFDAKDFGGKQAAAAHIKALPTQPSAIVDSGGGYHCYWLLAETWLLDDNNRGEARALQHAWVAAVGGDDGAKNLNRVLRVPGSLNVKEAYGPDYPRVTFVRFEDTLHTLEDLRASIPVGALERATQNNGVPASLDDYSRAGTLVSMLSSHRRDSYQDWLMVGQSLAALGGAGLAIWDGWSRGGSTYKTGECEKKWRGFDANGRTFASLVHWAKEDSPSEFERIYGRKGHDHKGMGMLQVGGVTVASDGSSSSDAGQGLAWSPDLKIEVKVGKDGKESYTFGEACLLHTETKRDGEWTPVHIPIAYNCWPMQRYRSEEEGEHGFRFAYLDSSQSLCYALLPAGAAVEKNAGKKACKVLADQGVRLATGSEHRLAFAMGHWAQQNDPPVVTLVRTSGWHGESAYVNGGAIFGQAGWFVDEHSPAIANRTGRAGTLERWQAGIRQRCDNKGLLTALAQSLAGALIEPLRLNPFMLHIWTDSTQGKSTAALLASAVWGNPDQTFKTWNTTTKSPEALAEQFNGACLVLDDTAKFDYPSDKFSQTIHALCSPIGRASLGQARALNVQRRWRCTLLSTGEISTRAKLGDHYQGGHRVRSLDLFCEAGSLASSKRHAEELRDFCAEQHGHVGDAWIAYLLQPGVLKTIRIDYGWWRQKAEALTGEGTEEGRIGGQLAALAVALDHATTAGLLHHSKEEIHELLKWCINGVLSDDGGGRSRRPSTPHERACRLMLNWLVSQPYRFPEACKSHNARDVVAYRMTPVDIQAAATLYTTEGMIGSSGLPELAAISARLWVQWCVAKGYARRDRLTLPGGHRNRWVIFDLNNDDFMDAFADTSDDEEEVSAEVSARKPFENNDEDTSDTSDTF